MSAAYKGSSIGVDGSFSPNPNSNAGVQTNHRSDTCAHPIIQRNSTADSMLIAPVTIGTIHIMA